MDGLSALDSRPVDGRMVSIASLVGLGSFLDGYDLLSVGIVLPLIASALGLSSAMSALIGTATYLGGVVGAVVFGYLGDLVGKREMFLVDVLFFLVGAVMSALSSSALELLAFRVMIGIGIGADIAVAPALLSDAAPSRSRGSLMALSLMMMPAGGLISVGVAYALIGAGVPVHLLWRLVLGLGAIPALAVMALRMALPESPRWLLRTGRVDRYRSTIASLMGVDPSAVEVPEVRREPISSVFTRYWRGLIYSTSAWIAVASTSVFTIFTTMILRSLGLRSYGGLLQFTGITWVAATAGALVGVLLLDRAGRRPTLLSSLALLAASYVAAAIAMSYRSTILLAASDAASLFFGFAAISAAYTVQSEVFPSEAKGVGSGLSFSANRVANFLFGFLAPLALAAGFLSGYLWAVALTVALLASASALVSVETSRKTLEEALKLQGRVGAHNS